MDYESIFYHYEEQYKNLNNERLKDFITLFCSKTKIDRREIELIYLVKEGDYEDLFLSLKDYTFKFYPQFISLFYQLLEESQYHMVYDLLDSMFILGSTTNKKLNREKSKMLLQSPYIQNISYENCKIMLNSPLGNYAFYSLRDYFRGNYEVMSYLRKNIELGGHCHNVSWDLMSKLEKASLVTELLPFYYEGTFYHSIVKNNVDGMYIDLANEVVYDEEIRQNLYQGQIICEASKEELENHLYDAIVASNKPNIEDDFYKPLLLALHKQCKGIRKE